MGNIKAFSSSIEHQNRLVQLKELHAQLQTDKSKVRVVNLVNQRPSLSRSSFTVPSVTADAKTHESATRVIPQTQTRPTQTQSSQSQTRPVFHPMPQPGAVRMELPHKTPRVNFWTKAVMDKETEQTQTPAKKEVVSEVTKAKLDALKNFHTNFMAGIRKPSTEKAAAPIKMQVTEAPKAKEEVEAPKEKAPLKSCLKSGPKDPNKVWGWKIVGPDYNAVDSVEFIERHIVPQYGDQTKSTLHPLREGMTVEQEDAADARIEELWTSTSEADLPRQRAAMRKEDPETADRVDENEKFVKHITKSTLQIDNPYNASLSKIESDRKSSKKVKREQVAALEEERLSKRKDWRVTQYISSLENQAYKAAVKHAEAMQEYYNS